MILVTIRKDRFLLATLAENKARIRDVVNHVLEQRGLNTLQFSWEEINNGDPGPDIYDRETWVAEYGRQNGEETIDPMSKKVYKHYHEEPYHIFASDIPVGKYVILDS